MKNTFRIHLTNVNGTGAIQLLTSLLPEIEKVNNAKITHLYLPDSGPLAHYKSKDANVLAKRYIRFLPNSISRFLECTLFSFQFIGNSPLFVAGDIPLFGIKNQILFLQNSHLLSKKNIFSYSLKILLMRLIFRINIFWVKSIIVQTNYMKELLINKHPTCFNKIFVINQPVPTWLINNNFKKTSPFKNLDKISLFYPASYYKHKNHIFLNSIIYNKQLYWPITNLYLTIEEFQNPATTVSWIKCIGLLDANKMIETYSKTDALIFLSKEESYGFPLLEAMFIGLPIICPDLPYARALCGSEAIYYTQDDIKSLNEAVLYLIKKINNGWWPNWNNVISNIPKNWNETATNFTKIIFHS